MKVSIFSSDDVEKIIRLIVTKNISYHIYLYYLFIYSDIGVEIVMYGLDLMAKLAKSLPQVDALFSSTLQASNSTVLFSVLKFLLSFNIIVKIYDGSGIKYPVC